MRNAIIVVLLALPVGWLAFGQSKKEPTSTGSFSGKQMAGLLKDMGYEPQELSDEVYQVSLERDGWKVHMMISLTKDGERFWLESKFAPIAEPDLVPAAAWRKLIEENERIGPAYFSFDKSDKRIHLYKSFDNVGLNPARLKKELDAFDATVRRTQTVWRVENFAPAEPLEVVPRAVEAPTDPMTALRGAWRVVRIEVKGEAVGDERIAKLRPSFALDGSKAVIKIGVEPERNVTVKIDAGAKPKRIDFTDEKGRVESGIYAFESDLLMLCVAGAGEERPRQFLSEAKNKTWLLVLKRQE
jgi:uncharacterized protein (TIGR03067 family)